MRPRLTYAQKSVLLQLVNHGDMQPADGNHKRTFQSLEERGYTQDVGYGRYAITEAGRRALQKGLVMKRLSIVFTCDSEPIGLYEIERRLRTAGFKGRRPVRSWTPNSPTNSPKPTNKANRPCSTP